MSSLLSSQIANDSSPVGTGQPLADDGTAPTLQIPTVTTEPSDDPPPTIQVQPKVRKLFPTRSHPARNSSLTSPCGDDAFDEEPIVGSEHHSTASPSTSILNGNGSMVLASSHAAQLRDIPFDRQVTYLDLSGLGLTTLDPLHLEVAFPSLITLNVSDNQLTQLPNEQFFKERRSTSAAQLWQLDFSFNLLSFNELVFPLASVCPVLGSLNLANNPHITMHGLMRVLSGLIVADLYLPEVLVGNMATKTAHGTASPADDIVDVLGGCLAVNGYCLPIGTAVQSKRFELVQQSLRTSANQWRPQRDLLRILHRRNMGDTTTPLDEARELLTCFVCANENLKITAKVKSKPARVGDEVSPVQPWQVPTPHQESTEAYAFNIQRSFWHQAPVQWNHWKMIDDHSDQAVRFSYIFVHTLAAAAECDYIDRETLAIVTALIIDEELRQQKIQHEETALRFEQTKSRSNPPPPATTSLAVPSTMGKTNSGINLTRNASTSNGDLSPNGHKKDDHRRHTNSHKHGHGGTSGNNTPRQQTPREDSLSMKGKTYSKEDEEIIAQIAGDVLSWPMYVLQYIAHRLCNYRQIKYPWQPIEIDVMIVHKHVQMALLDETFHDLVKVSPEFERRVKHFKQHEGKHVLNEPNKLGPRVSLATSGSQQKQQQNRRSAGEMKTQLLQEMPVGYRARLFSRLNGGHSIRDTLHYTSEEPSQMRQMRHSNTAQNTHKSCGGEEADFASKLPLPCREPLNALPPQQQCHRYCHHQPPDLPSEEAKRSPSKPTRTHESAINTFLTDVSGIEGGYLQAEVDESPRHASGSDVEDDEDGVFQTPTVTVPTAIVSRVEEEPLIGSDFIHPKGLLGTDKVYMDRFKDLDARNRATVAESRAERSDISYKQAVMKQPPLRIPRPSSCMAIQQQLQDQLKSQGEDVDVDGNTSPPAFHGHSTVNARRILARPGTPSHSQVRQPLPTSVNNTDVVRGGAHPIAKMTLEQFMKSRGIASNVCGNQRLITSVLEWDGGEGDDDLNVEARLQAVFEKGAGSQDPVDRHGSAASAQPISDTAHLHWPTPNYSLPKQSISIRSASVEPLRKSALKTGPHRAAVAQFSETSAARKLLLSTTPNISSSVPTNIPDGPSMRVVEAKVEMHPFTAKAMDTMNKLRERSELKRRIQQRVAGGGNDNAITACSASLRSTRTEKRGPDTHQFIPIEIRRELERLKNDGRNQPRATTK